MPSRFVIFFHGAPDDGGIFALPDRQEFVTIPHSKGFRLLLMTLSVTDLFCGAGGSSSGAVQVPGVTVRIAANHWQLAIDTHNTNHLATDHACADISQVNPRLFPRTDILWASPECTNHSQARGRKRDLDSTLDLFGDVLPDEAAERSRATMWDVPRFAEVHNYRAIIVENVVDAALWVMYDSWLHAMTALGYEHYVVYMNSMHAQVGGLPAPQSRDRMYVVFWKRGATRPDFDKWTRPHAYCAGCDEWITAVQAWKKPTRWGRYRAQYVWRCPRTSCRNAIVEPAWLPAATAIDWSLKGERIGDRSTPLKAKTLARIEAGLAKFAVREPNPFLTLFRSGRARNTPLSQTLSTIVADGSNHALLVPVGGGWNEDATHTTQAMRTRTTRDIEALVVPSVPAQVAAPGTTPATEGLLVPYDRTGVARSARNPHRTFTTHDRAALDLHPAMDTTGLFDTVGTTDRHSEVACPPHALRGRPAHGADDQPSRLPGRVRVEDCEFRMLSPLEQKLGQAFAGDYTILGKHAEQVRQIGNAVTPPTARDLIACIAETFHPVCAS